MAPMGVACQAMPRWLTTPLAASPASFQPSNPAMATGDASSPMSLNSMTRHLPSKCRSSRNSLRGHPCSLGDRLACPCSLVSAVARIRSDLRKLRDERLGLASMSTLRTALAERVVVADGAMGTMLQASDATVDDFAGYEGCNEILNVTRPDIVTGIHEAYLEAGADCVTTSSFGANLGNLGGYGIAERIAELSEASARLARAAAARWATPDRPRWVLGSMGPGTKLPTLGHTTFRDLRDTYQVNAEGLLRGGADALIIETCQDLLQAKAAIIGARRAVAELAPDALVIAQVTIETTGTMLLGTEIGAALTALEPLGIDMIGLNCATGPGEMSEHLRYLAAHARVPISCEPNAGLPVLTSDGASYPLTPAQLAEAPTSVT